jgi:hypothetical protein
MTGLLLGRPALGDEPKLQTALAQLPSVLGVQLAEHKLADVEEKLGPAKPVNNGLRAAAEAENLCYRGPDGTILLFAARTENAHGNGLTGFQLVRDLKLAHYGEEDEFDGAQPAKPKCGASKLVSRKLATGGVSLGLDRAQVVEKLGPPTVETAARLKYESHTESGEWTTTITLAVELEKEKVVAIRAGATTSN